MTDPDCVEQISMGRQTPLSRLQSQGLVEVGWCDGRKRLPESAVETPVTGASRGGDVIAVDAAAALDGRES